MVCLRDVRLPVELWNALDGEPAAFVARLRSDEPLSRPERDCFAMWLENGLRPPGRGRGRPEESWIGGMRCDRLGRAAFRFRRVWAYIKGKGWHRQKAGKLCRTKGEVMQAVARKHRVDERSLANLVKRGSDRGVIRLSSLRDYWIRHLEKKRKK